MKSIFHLEEAFETGFGIVVTGRMKIGDVEKGNFLLMPDGNKIEVAGIEYAKKSFGMKGDNVSILLKDVTRDYIKSFISLGVVSEKEWPSHIYIEVVSIEDMRDDKLNELGI